VDLDAYVAEHAGEWRRLDQLSHRRRLSADQADELVALYQRAATHLSVIRSRSPDPALVAQLSRSVLGARSAITGGAAFSWSTVGRFFLAAFPLAVYRGWKWWVSVLVACSAVSGGLMAYVVANPDVARLFMSDDQIDAVVTSDFASYYTENQAQNFAFLVWTNNSLVAAQCLAAGVLIVPVFYLLWWNEFNLGLMGGVMIANDRSDVFFGLITPHGLLELTAVYVAAGFGLRIGWAWISPGPTRTRAAALASTAREAMLVALGLVPVLAVSGLIEAFVTPSALPTPVRIAIGVLAWGGFLCYVLVLGRRAATSGEETDLSEFERGAEAPAA
jgi:uncharacterized membrane protein SpoIIM required for sporulation